MATRVFRGDAVNVAQVTTVAVSGTWATSDTATWTVNGKSLTLTVGTDTTTAQIATAMKEMWNGDAQTGTGDHTFSDTGNNITEYSGITATVNSSTVTLTADTAGVPFTVSVSEVTAGTGALGTPTEATANDGKNTLSANNVTGGSLSGAGNDLVFENGATAVKYGLDQSSGGTWTALRIKANHEADIGLPRINGTGASAYAEYRDRELNINASTVEIGAGEGKGSKRLLVNLGSVQSAIYVFKTDTATEDDYHALRLRGTHASNTLEVSGGTVDLAAEGGQTATIATLTVSGTGTVRTSKGTTLTTVNVTGSGALVIDSATGLSDITTINIYDQARVTILGDNAITTINLNSGTLDYRASGTITTLNVSRGGTFTTANASAGFTVTNSTLYGGTILDKGGWATWTNASSVPNGLSGLSLDFGTNHSMKIS